VNSKTPSEEWQRSRGSDTVETLAVGRRLWVGKAELASGALHHITQQRPVRQRQRHVGSAENGEGCPRCVREVKLEAAVAQKGRGSEREEIARLRSGGGKGQIVARGGARAVISHRAEMIERAGSEIGEGVADGE